MGWAGVTVISPPRSATAARVPSTVAELTRSPRKSRLNELSDWVAVALIVAIALTRSTFGRAFRCRS
jgi:hypothetical protein